jgi:hypothetical protein
MRYYEALRQESAAVVVVVGWVGSGISSPSTRSDCDFWAGTRQTPEETCLDELYLSIRSGINMQK